MPCRARFDVDYYETHFASQRPPEDGLWRYWKLYREDPAYVEWDRMRPHKIVSRLRPLLPPGARILDFGCGRGLMSAALDGLGRVVGFDVLPEMAHMADARILHEGAGARILLADGMGLPFRSGTFDAVVCESVLEHVPDAGKAIAEIGRVLKPSGRLYLDVPNRLWLFGGGHSGPSSQLLHWRGRRNGMSDAEMYVRWGRGDPCYVRLFTYGALSSLLRACGFGEVRSLPSERGGVRAWLTRRRIVQSFKPILVIARKAA